MPRPPSLRCGFGRGTSLGGSPFDFVLLQPVFQCIELRLPIVAVVVDPDGGFIERTGIEAAGADAAAAFLADKARPDQNLDVARDRLHRYRVGCRNARYLKRLLSQAPQNVASRSIRESEENTVQSRGFGSLLWDDESNRRLCTGHGEIIQRLH